MKLHPLHSIDMIARTMQMTGEYFDPNRCTGRSTILALEYITQALKQPHVWIPIHDHESTQNARDFLTRLVKDYVDALQLRYITVDRRGYIGFGTCPAILPRHPIFRREA